MKRNVGAIDSYFRLIASISMILLGLFYFDGIKGDTFGIALSVIALFPMYVATTKSCIVFSWFGIHSLSRNECKKYGTPNK